MEGAAIDSVINPLACATTLSTCARATAGVLQMSNSRGFSRTAHDSSNRARNPSFRDDQLHAAYPHDHNVPKRIHPLR